MHLTDAQIAHYRRAGHLTVPGVFTAAETDVAYKRSLESTGRLANDKYENALKGHDEVKSAFRALLVGFGAFTFNLVSSLTLDPSVEKALLASVGAPQGAPADPTCIGGSTGFPNGSIPGC